MKTLTLALIVTATVAVCSANSVTNAEWDSYKGAYNKAYTSLAAENQARYYYAVNKQRVDTHNQRATQNLESYTLGVNQYSDLRFLEFAALFPLTTEMPTNSAPFTVPAAAAAPSFLYADQGYSSPVQDQGEVCNSGWAYAAAVALKIFDDVNTAALNSQALSAQNFIDCAGGSKGCTNQVSQLAFDYLTVYNQKVYPITEYPNKPLEGQGVCAPPAVQTNGKTLTAYSSVPNGDDATLMKVVNVVAPVVIKFNPGSFEFMHYKAGVFTQPAPTQSASHYMTVVGYGTDAATSKNYWLVQNSFGTSWGESGFIKIERNPAKSIALSAIFPSQL